tara:strand:+ start:106 stop:420 length:315 start_codon:yes stop_codon:yes gene_type:complete
MPRCIARHVVASNDVKSANEDSKNAHLSGCAMMTRIACHGMRNYYILHHFQRYEETLNHAEYRAVLNLSVEDARLELESIRRKNWALQQCAVVGLSEMIIDLKL